jgi:acetoacetyl-CoA synthetase
MPSIRPVLLDDFEGIAPLFSNFQGSSLTDKDRYRLFSNRWGSVSPRWDIGYVLAAQDALVGYLGLIHCDRILDGRIKHFCNLTSWVVHEDFRSHSLLLLLQALKLEDTTLTVFSASPTTFPAYRQLGFEILEERIRIIFPLFPTRISSRITVTQDSSQISKKLSEKSLIIYNDHLGLPCIHLLLSIDQEECYVCLNMKAHKKIPYGHILYISNPSWFFENSNEIVSTLCFTLRMAMLSIDERHCAEVKLKGSIQRKLKVPRLFKSYTMPPASIDLMYSELPLLNL